MDYNKFYSRIKKTKKCWVWIGRKTKAGYGQFYIGKGKSEYAHRIMWHMANRGLKIKKGFCVLHHCDNPPCVKPTHLFRGTQQDNIQDMINKGRKAYSIGESHYRSKLKEKDIIFIRKKWRNYGDQVKLAKKFGVDPKTITSVLRGITWKHVQ